jgi:hypothetical protein
MTQLTLDANTQSLINTAIASPGTNNVNYLNAYNAIYNQLTANGNINPGVVTWFSMAGQVNTEQYGPNAAGAFLWGYTIAAAASEAAHIRDTGLPSMHSMCCI